MEEKIISEVLKIVFFLQRNIFSKQLAGLPFRMVLASPILAQRGMLSSSRLSLHGIATHLKNKLDFVPKEMCNQVLTE